MSGGFAALLALAMASCGATSATQPAQPRPTTRPAASARPTAAISSPRADQPLLHNLGILRRPQTPADLDDPGVRRQLRFMARRPEVAGKPVVELVRLAIVAPWGQKVFLVPSMLLGRKRLTLSSPATVGATAAQIKAGRDWGTERSNRLVIVIPDGVAKVSVWPAKTSTDEFPSPVTATVHNNIAAFESRQNLDDPQREVWYGPSGKIIKRIAHPSRSRHARLRAILREWPARRAS